MTVLIRVFKCKAFKLPKLHQEFISPPIYYELLITYSNKLILVPKKYNG